MKKCNLMLHFSTLCIILPGMFGTISADEPVRAIGKYLCINYKPFFPIGLYSFPDKRNDDAMWKEASDAGFNFVLSGESGKHGIYVSKAIPWKTIGGLRVSLMELYRDKSLLIDLKSFLAQNENDTTIICWHAPDEPGWFGPSAHSLRLGYEAIKDNSKKPVWLNIGPSFTLQWQYNPPRDLYRALDIISEDIYPIPERIPKPSQSNNDYAYYVGEHAKKLVEFGSIDGVPNTPVWMVLQGFSWADMGRSQNTMNATTYPPPTKHELRFMTYDAVVHGATGILWYGVGSTETVGGAQIWNDLKSIASELRDLYSIWTCPFEVVPEKLSITVRDNNNPDAKVPCLIKLFGDKVYILAVNTCNVPLEKVTFSVARDKGVLTTVKVLTENRQLQVAEKTSWTDQFEGYGVHIYETDIYYSFMSRYFKDPTITKTEPAKK